MNDNEPLMQFLAFGMIFDHAAARRSLDELEAARVAWFDQHGPADLSDADLLALLNDIVRDALAPHEGLPLTMGLSGGFGAPDRS